MCPQVYFPAHFTMTFDISCNCHDMSQSAVTKQNYQSAILTFIFLTFLKKAS